MKRGQWHILHLSILKGRWEGGKHCNHDHSNIPLLKQIPALPTSLLALRLLRPFSPQALPWFCFRHFSLLTRLKRRAYLNSKSCLFLGVGRRAMVLLSLICKHFLLFFFHLWKSNNLSNFALCGIAPHSVKAGKVCGRRLTRNHLILKCIHQ